MTLLFPSFRQLQLWQSTPSFHTSTLLLCLPGPNHCHPKWLKPLHSQVNQPFKGAARHQPYCALKSPWMVNSIVNFWRWLGDYMCPWNGNKVFLHAWPTTSSLWRKPTMSPLLVWLLMDANDAFGYGEQLLHRDWTFSISAAGQSVVSDLDGELFWALPRRVRETLSALRGSGLMLSLRVWWTNQQGSHTVSRFQ